MKVSLELEHDDGSVYGVDVDLPPRPDDITEYGYWFDEVAEAVGVASRVLLVPEQEAYLAYFKQAK